MAQLNLYNTLGRTLQPFKPASPPHVTLYTCGPTVYDYPHVGNWRTFVFYDTLVRTLRAHGLQIEHVLNITDVGHLTNDEDEGEDKLAKAAAKQRKTAWDIAQFYTDDFMHGLELLNIIKPDHLPRATEYIDQQIKFIQNLEGKGFTYQIDDGVYFDTSKLDDYGRLAQLDQDKLKAGARVEFSPQKRNISDFALWKLTPAGQNRDMEWDSPWGKGFPGWHLECSVMAEALLGPTVDIHAGGIDHIPVHHTNEIAQSEAAHDGQPLANIWLHAQHLMVNDAKIAKSEGSGITLQEVTDHGHDLMALRLMYLQSHYQTSANFSWDVLAAAANRLSTLKQLAQLRWQPINQPSEDEAELIIRTGSEVLAALSDNLNTPKALEVIATLVDQLSSSGISPDSLDMFNKLLNQLDDWLGLKLVDSTPDIKPEAKELIAQREAAREQQDFARSDELRDELATKHHLELNDTPRGALWRWVG